MEQFCCSGMSSLEMMKHQHAEGKQKKVNYKLKADCREIRTTDLAARIERSTADRGGISLKTKTKSSQCPFFRRAKTKYKEKKSYGCFSLFTAASKRKRERGRGEIRSRFVCKESIAPTS